jgi:hypothetical protein
MREWAFTRWWLSVPIGAANGLMNANETSDVKQIRTLSVNLLSGGYFPIGRGLSHGVFECDWPDTIPAINISPGGCLNPLTWYFSIHHQVAPSHVRSCPSSCVLRSAILLA